MSATDAGGSPGGGPLEARGEATSRCAPPPPGGPLHGETFHLMGGTVPAGLLGPGFPLAISSLALDPHFMQPLWIIPVALIAIAPASTEPPPSERNSPVRERARVSVPEEEVATLWALVREQPEDPQAERALIRIASICEQELGRFDQAEEAYQLLIARAPAGRRGTLARKRLAKLREARATGDEPLRRYNRILREYASIEVELSLRQMRELMSSYPNFVHRDHLVFLSGVLLAREGRHIDAARYLEELIETYPESQWVYPTIDELGRCYVELRRFDAAERTFERFLHFSERDPGAPQVAAHRMLVIHRFRLLRRLFLLSSAVAGVACLVWIFGTRWRSLRWGDGVAALVVTVIHTLVFLAALHSMPAESDRVHSALLYTWIALIPAGALGTLWASTRRPGVLRAVAASLAVLVAALAIAYTVYYQQDAANLLLDSIQGSGILEVS